MSCYDRLTAGVERDTDSIEQIYIVRATHFMWPLYRAERFPLPLAVTPSYRDRFAGSGPVTDGSSSEVLKTRYIGLRVQVIF